MLLNIEFSHSFKYQILLCLLLQPMFESRYSILQQKDAGEVRLVFIEGSVCIVSLCSHPTLSWQTTTKNYTLNI